MSDAFQAWRSQGKTFQFNQHAVFYQVEGQEGGSCLLCIHGLPTASWDYHLLWPTLRTSFDLVLAPDMLGFGFSAKPMQHDYSIAEQADLHEQLLRHYGVRRVHILAHDYGVTVAQELLARHNQRASVGDRSLSLESVCLLNGGLFPESHRPLLIQKLMLTKLGPLLSRLLNFGGFGQNFSKVFGPRTKPSREQLEQFWQLVQANEGRRMFYRLFHYIPERRAQRERWVSALVNTQVPTRLINGPEDPVSGAHLVTRYQELVPQADVVVLPGIGHYPQVEDPEGVLKACQGLWQRANTHGGAS